MNKVFMIAAFGFASLASPVHAQQTVNNQLVPTPSATTGLVSGQTVEGYAAQAVTPVQGQTIQQQYTDVNQQVLEDARRVEQQLTIRLQTPAGQQRVETVESSASQGELRVVTNRGVRQEEARPFFGPHLPEERTVATETTQTRQLSVTGERTNREAKTPQATGSAVAVKREARRTRRRNALIAKGERALEEFSADRALEEFSTDTALEEFSTDRALEEFSELVNQPTTDQTFQSPAVTETLVQTETIRSLQPSSATKRQSRSRSRENLAAMTANAGRQVQQSQTNSRRLGYAGFWLLPIGMTFLTWFGWRCYEDERALGAPSVSYAGSSKTKSSTTRTMATSRTNASDTESTSTQEFADLRTERRRPTSCESFPSLGAKTDRRKESRISSSEVQFEGTKTVQDLPEIECRDNAVTSRTSEVRVQRQNTEASEAESRCEVKAESRSETQACELTEEGRSGDLENRSEEEFNLTDPNRMAEESSNRSASKKNAKRSNKRSIVNLDAPRNSRGREEAQRRSETQSCELKESRSRDLETRNEEEFDLTSSCRSTEMSSKRSKGRSQTRDEVQSRSTERSSTRSSSKSRKDDLTKIKGIGPATAKLLNAEGIYCFTELRDASPQRTEQILNDAGAKFQLIDCSTWCEQADFAVRGDFDGLKTWLRDNADRFSNSSTRTRTVTTSSRSGSEESTTTRRTSFTRSDDLTRIKGIGPATKRALNRQGITSFEQIASLDSQRISKLLSEFNEQFGLVDSETWAEQAREILGEGFELTQTEAEILAELNDIKRYLNRETSNKKSSTSKSKDVVKN